MTVTALIAMNIIEPIVKRLSASLTLVRPENSKTSLGYALSAKTTLILPMTRSHVSLTLAVRLRNWEWMEPVRTANLIIELTRLERFVDLTHAMMQFRSC